MQAIRTRYHAPGNARGARISAQCEAGRIYMPYRHDLDIEANHAVACAQLMAKLGWKTTMPGGCFNGDYYWVFADDRSPRATTRNMAA